MVPSLSSGTPFRSSVSPLDDSVGFDSLCVVWYDKTFPAPLLFLLPLEADLSNLVVIIFQDHNLGSRVFIATSFVIVSRTFHHTELGNLCFEDKIHHLFILIPHIQINDYMSFAYPLLSNLFIAFIPYMPWIPFLNNIGYEKIWTSCNYSFALSQVMYTTISDADRISSRTLNIFLLVFFLTVLFILWVYSKGCQSNYSVFKLLRMVPLCWLRH